MWFSARDGLTKFDGNKFYKYSPKEGVPFSSIGSVNEDSDGNIWIGSNIGMLLLKNGKAIALDTALGLPRTACLCIFKDADGTMWAGNNKGVYHFNPLNLQKPLIKFYHMPRAGKNDAVRYMKRKKDGTLIAGTDFGYFISKQDSFIQINTSGNYVYSVMEFENGKEWFSGWGNPILQYKNNKHDSIIDLGASVMKMTKDRLGNIWMATYENGIYKYNGKDFISYGKKEGLNFKSFWTCFTDNEGNVWFGSFGNGVYKYSGDKFTSITEINGILDNHIMSLDCDTNGKIWMSSQKTISCYNPTLNTIINFDSYNNKPFNSFFGFMVDKKNQVLALGYGSNGYKISQSPKGKELYTITQEEWIGGFGALRDRAGNTCFGSEDNGLQILQKDGTFKKFKSSKKLNSVVGISQDKLGNYWLDNGYEGINYFNGKKNIYFTRKNGFVNTRGTSACCDSENNYWIGTNGLGIYKCKFINDSTLLKIDSLTVDNGLGSNDINSIDIVNNTMYIATGYGLSVMKMSDYMAHKKNVINYTKEDGLVSDNCSFSYIDPSGKIWITTETGVYIYQTGGEKINTIETKNHIQNIQLHYENIDWNSLGFEIDNDGIPQKLVLPYDNNHLTFDFIGVCHSAPSKVKYQYMLKGADKEWSPVSKKNEAVFSNIPPGTYTFMVKSCNNDGIWNTKPLSYIFKIEPPFWKRIWFIALCAILFFVAVYYFIKFREQKLQKQNLILESKVKERTHELNEQKEIVEDKNKEITDSINYASRIQSVLLPSEKEISNLLYNNFILLKPKDIVSGDFYWVAEKNEFVYLAVCDSTGHGVPGAFMSLLNLNLLNEAIIEKNITQPHLVFNYVRQQLISNISKEGQKDGFDGILMCFNKKTNQMTYAAANNNPVLITSTELIHLPHNKMPVGMGEIEESFTLFTHKLEPNSYLYFYTDGYADQFGGPKGKKFKYRPLEQLLLEIHELDLQTQKDKLTQVFDHWKGNLEQVDDVLIIGIKIT